MAALFTAMAGDEVDEAVGDDAPADPEEEDQRTQQTSMYLTRLLFLLFGDDAGLWENDLFYRFVLEQTTAEHLGPQLNSLFEVFNTPGIPSLSIARALGEVPLRQRLHLCGPDAHRVFRPGDARRFVERVSVSLVPHLPGRVRVDVPSGQVQGSTPQ